MKVTHLSAQQRQPNRVNVFVDGVYRLSLDMYQVTELGVKIGREYTEDELAALEEESAFGKLYARTLDYILLRPHSSKEIRDYLYRKTRATPVRRRNRQSGEQPVFDMKPGVSKTVADGVYKRLVDKGYVDDRAFARWWVENRHVRKGTSLKKLEVELRAKGIASEIIQENIQNSPRDEKSELVKVILKKKYKYDDEDKFVQYLMRQGFRYDDIREVLAEAPPSEEG